MAFQHMILALLVVAIWGFNFVVIQIDLNCPIAADVRQSRQSPPA